MSVQQTPVASDALARGTVNRVLWRLMPFLFLCYVVAYLDRVNIGFAATQLQRDLGLSDAAYGWGAGIFFLGYCLFEIPSNLVLERVGARRWIARIMVSWGLVSMGMALVRGPSSFYAARVLLGIAEAGFFPGIILYLTYWVPAADRARAGAYFMAAGPVSAIVGAPVSGALLELHGWLGVAGWQWLFVIEGVPAIVLGIVTWWYLTDRPEDARWLSDDQRRWLTGEMDRERAARASHQRGSEWHAQTSVSEWQAMLSGRVWLLGLIYFLNALVNYGVFLWLPKILHDASALRNVALGLVTAIPFVLSLAAMVLVGRHSDRTGERKWHAAGCALTAATGLLLAALFPAHFPLLVLSLALSELGHRSTLAVFWAIPPIVLAGSAAAAGIALINSIGNLGGAVGPTVVGWLRSGSGDYTSGLLFLTGCLVLQAVLIASLRLSKVKGRR